jgi:hypothetical protein
MSYKQDSTAENDRDSFFRELYSSSKRKKFLYQKWLLIFLLLVLIFVSYDTSANDCGSLYSTNQSNGEIYQTYVINNDSVCSDTVFVTGVDYAVLIERATSLEGLKDLLVTPFAFDPEVFAIVEGALILAFLTSHFAGRIVRWLGKT